jgi:hypothetical protein
MEYWARSAFFQAARCNLCAIMGSKEVLMQKKNADYYVLIVFGDVLPNLQGPFADEPQRDAHARKLKARYGDKHGIFALDVDPDGLSTVNAYSAMFFEDGSQ